MIEDGIDELILLIENEEDLYRRLILYANFEKDIRDDDPIHYDFIYSELLEEFEDLFSQNEYTKILIGNKQVYEHPSFEDFIYIVDSVL